VERIDPAKNRVVRTLRLPGAAGVVAAFGSIWATGQEGVVRIDPATNTVTATVKVGSGPFVITEIAGEAWIPSWHGRDIWRLRP
jgi:virginiamycin B lyase